MHPTAINSDIEEDLRYGRRQDWLSDIQGSFRWRQSENRIDVSTVEQLKNEKKAPKVAR